MARKKHRYTPSHIILFSSLTVIISGIVLLMLPLSQKASIPLIDIVFTSISASTGTGLLSTSLHNFTPFGLSIITLLAQIGALGVIVLTIFFLYIFFEKNQITDFLPENILKKRNPKRVKPVLLFVILFTVLAELVGGIIIAFGIRNSFAWPQALLYGLFHAISAFSSIGISLFENNMELYSQNPLVLIPLIFLMILGIIGFVVLIEFFQHMRLGQKKKHQFSLSSKITLLTISLLLIFAIGIFWGLEEDHALAAYNPLKTILNSIFNATSCMGIGFHTVPVNSLRLPTLLMAMIIAFIGTAPGSTGSGIRTTTIAILWSSVEAVIWSRPYVTILGNRIPTNQVRKAIAIIALSVPWIIFTTFILLILEPEYSFLQILFESVSAFATFGMSTGITPYLSTISKILLSISMFLGRIGPFTLIFAIKNAIEPKKVTIPEKPLLLG